MNIREEVHFWGLLRIIFFFAGTLDYWQHLCFEHADARGQRPCRSHCEVDCNVMPMLSLQQNEVGGGLVAIENSTPEVIHVVNVSSPLQRSHQIAPIDSSNMQTITISAASLNFPLNLVCTNMCVK